MKKKVILLFAFIINLGYICFAQPQERNGNKAEAIQIAYLTKELDLTPDEAQKFWPVFNNYKQEMIATRRENSDDEIALEEKVINVRKKYKPDFKRILGSDQRVNKLFQADKNFREMLRKELMKRRGQGQMLRQNR
jgi:phosphoglycolate phosphatase-like HAD superfamily hydrolase